MATTAKGYHYPLGSDRLADGDDILRSLATDCDTILGVAAAGTTAAVALPVVGTPASVAITFPVGRFTAAPTISVTPRTNNPQQVYAGAANPTTAGVNAWVCRNTGTAAIAVDWYAVQL
jgi:hypothetical protein